MGANMRLQSHWQMSKSQQNALDLDQPVRMEDHQVGARRHQLWMLVRKIDGRMAAYESSFDVWLDRTSDPLPIKSLEPYLDAPLLTAYQRKMMQRRRQVDSRGFDFDQSRRFIDNGYGSN